MGQDPDSNLSERIITIYSDILKKEQERIRSALDSQKYIIRSVLGIGSFLIVGLGGAAVYLIGNSVSELKSEVLQLAHTRVQAEILQQTEEADKIAGLAAGLEKAYDDYEQYKIAIDALANLAALETLGIKDPYGTYSKLNNLSEKSEQSGKPLSDEERATAIKLLESALEAGVQGLTDPNTLFNTAVVASKLNFNNEAVKLAVLAEHWKPSITHKVIRAEYATLYGIAFTFDGSELSKVDKSASEVRVEAWESLIEVVSQVPRQEGEQAYSRAVNVAVRNRSSGFYPTLIETIEKSRLNKENSMTSYAFTTLARLYTFDASPGWSKKYWQSVDAALKLLGEESPVASWYQHSLSDLLETAYRIDQLEEFLARADSAGITRDVWTSALGSASPTE